MVHQTRCDTSKKQPLHESGAARARDDEVPVG